MKARKIMLIGEIGVGKSSLARRVVHGTFETTYTPTVGADVYTHTVALPGNAGEMRLVVWDTDGSFGDAIFRHVYIKQAAGALIVGDVTRRASLDRMLMLAEGFAEAMPGRHVGFVVNKVDLLMPGEEPDLPSGLRQPGSDVTRTSAMTGDGVAEAFLRMAVTIDRRGL